jgi:hypothetical protein
VASNKRGTHATGPTSAAHEAPRPASTFPIPGNGTKLLRKAVNTLAIIPKSTRITTLGRKTYNVLLYQAQEQGLEREVFRAPLESIISGLDFDSNDYALIKKHLRAMVSTTVEWQSPTTGEGSAWHVSGLLAHATLSKQGGQVWVEWSYAVNLKQELLEPTVFARLRLEVISQLRSHAAVALYEICTRYKDIGQTARQEWRWWVPVLSGNPVSEKSARLEYRIFKRDTLKPAVAEINAITDIEVELVEHKQGRAVGEIQFRIRPKRQASLPMSTPPQPVDLALITRAQRLGVGDDAAEAMAQDYGDEAFRAGLDSLERRLASNYPEPLRDPVRYLRALMPGEAARASKRNEDAAALAAATADAASPASREMQDKRRARWLAEWTRRQHERLSGAIEAMSPQAQKELEASLLITLQARGAHPSILKRLATSGWQHPMVRQEMLRHYGAATHGDRWDQPSAEQLLAIAAELGEVGDAG